MESRALCGSAYCEVVFRLGDPMSRDHRGRLRETRGRCCCRRCAYGEYDDANMGLPLASTRMYVCHDCGSKRCARAEDHEFYCDGGS